MREIEQTGVVAHHPGTRDCSTAGNIDILFRAADSITGLHHLAGIFPPAILLFIVVMRRLDLVGPQRHLEYLNELSVVGPRVERQAERQCQCGRTVEFAITRVHQTEGAVSGFDVFCLVS